MRKFFPLLVIIIFTSCQNELHEKGTHEYISEIKEWHKKRIDNLKKENGWLNLVGLMWLNEGENKFGSDQSNNLVFPEGKTEPFMGSLFLEDSTVTIEINKNIKVFLKEGGQVEKIILKHDQQPGTTVLSYASLRWFLIKRGNKYGIRLRDLEADLVKNFEGIETYPVNSDWKFEAKFEKYDPPKKIAVPNILGTIDEEKSPGALVFKKGGKEYKLDALNAGDSYFLIFADETSGVETYGGGRFLYTPKADSTGKLFVDFNRTYNPPCVFTKYATCPLPPKQNHLRMQITAGEKNYGHGH